MIKKLVLIALLFLSLPSFGQEITVAAAADLRYALTDIVSKYRENDSTAKINLIFGSSGNLCQQILNQAPFDIFFSADNSYPQKLAESKLTLQPVVRYAIGHLVLYSIKKDVSKGLALLKDADVKKIAIANPDVAPYGKRAAECLKYYKIDKLLEDKIVKGDNVSQAAQFVLTGNAEAGLIALSLALSAELSGKGKYYPIDDKSYSPLDQSYVLLKHAQGNKLAEKFINFLATGTARKIFIKYGFRLPGEK